MNVYVDSSVLLRVILGEPEPLATWHRIDVAVSSELIRVECLRTIDRARIQFRLADEAVARHRAEALQAIDAMDIVPVAQPILERAAEPFPTSVGTLDALHLSSALLVRGRYDGLSFATHDQTLGVAAIAVGFSVDGIRP